MSDDVVDPLWLRNLRAQASGSEPLHEESVRAGAAYAVAEIDRLRSLLPPAGLPATLASVDDVRRVCEAAGLSQCDGGWRGDEPGDNVYVITRKVGSGSAIVQHIGTIFGGSPSWLLWHAIQAARSAS